MRSTLALLAAAAVIATAIFTGVFNTPADAATGPIPLNCDRACLERPINQYLDALAKRDPSGLPLSKDLRYSENFSLMELGDGFWKTVEGRGKYTHIFADPDAAQVGYMGTIMEAGGPILMSTRLRIELGRITEIENMFFKPGGGGPNNIAFMAYCTFDQGTVNKGVLSTGKQFEFKGMFNRSSSIMVSEAFLIEPTPGGPFPGGIRRVEMVGTTAPYHLAAPWPGGLSGN